MPHSATLTWNIDPDLPNPLVAGSGYNIYKGNKPGTEGATPLNGTTPVAATTYVDTAVTAGEELSYFVTAVLNGVESGHSNEFTVTVPLQAPDGLTVVVV